MYKFTTALRKELRRAFDALQLAHCGEMLLPHEKTRILRNNLSARLRE